MGDEKIVEYRGIANVHVARLIADTKEKIEYETPQYLAGTSELTRETETASETHYYDNKPEIVIDSTGADTVNLNVSAVPLEMIAYITGQKYIKEKRALIESTANAPYMAMGYVTKDTSGEEVWVWRLKGKFGKPSETHGTENDSGDANGQELAYTGIETQKTFAVNDGKSMRSYAIPAKEAGMTEEEFFSKVQLPDDIFGTGTPGDTTQGAGSTGEQTEAEG